MELGNDEPDVLLHVVLVVEGGEGGHVLQEGYRASSESLQGGSSHWTPQNLAFFPVRTRKKRLSQILDTW